ncbi:MAG: 16S rRNA (cytidine(1402)-2'-O)-methyltransferase [Flaviflexus sp.]|nr:16S rRNA (cytidine(1402)-2'-O)-methyltransferase [Flaviflexus sp.]
MSEPRIFLAATPIGDPSDATPGLVDLLTRADLIAAEDTRKVKALATRLGIRLTAQVQAFHDHNEAAQVTQLLERATAGQTILVVSDAGMPTVSDPGFRLVRAAHEAGVPLTVIPGPSAVLTALAISGIPTDRFCFEGFLPRKTGERIRALTKLAAEERTLVFFESPRRLADTLADMAKAFGEHREAAVCRELTKVHEEVRRGPLGELADWAREGVRGEITLVVAPRDHGEDGDPGELAAEALELARRGLRLKDACSYLAQKHSLSTRELYQAALAAKEEPGESESPKR